jgi:hypothetical protein
MKTNQLFTMTVAAAIALQASLAFADDSLLVTLPGQTYTSGTGNTGAVTIQTVGTSFAPKLEAVGGDGVTLDASFTGTVIVTYTGPTGRATYVTNVTFASGKSTTTLNTTLVDVQTTTLSATATGAMTPIASSTLQVNPILIVTLPGQTFTAGTGNSGTASVQTAGTPFNITSLTAVNSDFTIDTALSGSQNVTYTGPANSPNGATPTYTTSATFTAGQSTLLPTTLVDEQSVAITANILGAATGVASSSVTVAASGATQLGFGTSPGGGPANAVWAAQPVVSVEDATGNVVTGKAQSVTLSIQSNPAGGTLSGTLTMAVNTNTGLATFSGLSIDKVGLGYTLTARGNTLDTSAGVVVSSPFNIIVLSAYDNLVIADGAYGYWPLQETTGPVFFDIGSCGTNAGVMYTSTDPGLGGNAADEHNIFAVAGANSTDGGTYSLGDPGPFTNWDSGDVGISFTNLNGQLSNSDIVISVYNAAMDSHIFTAEAWINIQSYPIGYTNQFYQVPLGFEANGGSHSGWFIEVFDDREGAGGSDAEGNVLFNLAPSSNSGDNSQVTPHTLSGLGWTHVVEVFDGSNLRCYFNGTNIANTAETYSSVTEFPAHLIPMVIGSSCVSYFPISGGSEATGFERGFFWHGGVAHVALYHTALTAGQILNHYLTGIYGPNCTALIASQPIGVTNYVGYSPSLSVSATGSNVVYQWYQNSKILVGQTNQTLTLNNLVLSNAGTYYASVANACSSTNSDPAVVAVLPLPSDPYQSNIIKALPRAYYPLHEAGLATNDMTVAQDLIGEGDNNGTYAGFDTITTPLLGQPGPGGSTDLGTSVTLDGSIPNGIFLSNASAMDITGNSTMEVWIQVEDPGNGNIQNIIEHGPAIEANPSKSENFLGFDGIGDYYVGSYKQLNAAQPYTDAFYPVPLADVGQWVYLVGTSDGVAWHLYRNAQEVANLSDTNGAIDANGGWAIGARNNMNVPPNNVINPTISGSTGLTASINNVALYDYALTPGQILAHYQVGLRGATSPVSNPISIQADGLGNVILTWSYGTIQQASSASGPWADVVLALSPYTVKEITTTFFRAVIK